MDGTEADPPLAELFSRLFAGDAAAKEYCKTVDEVGGGKADESVESSILATRPAATAAAGIENHNGLYTLVDEAKFSSYNKLKNDARVNFHAVNQAALEQRLQQALQTTDVPAAEPLGDVAAARTALGRMASVHGLVATALLQGVRAALVRQAADGSASRTHWTLSTAHLINGGAAYVDDAVNLLRVCGYERLEAGGDELEAGDRDHMRWALRTRWWSRSQLRFLAGAVRVDSDVAPAGRLSSVSLSAATGSQASAVAEPSFELRADEWLSWCAVL